MVEADTVKRVEKCEAALDLVRFDHAFEDVLNRHALALARQVVRDGEDGSEIVGRVAPLEKNESNGTIINLGGGGSTRSNARTYILQRGNSR